VDFRTLSYEFTRNGRRYQLNPLMKEPKLRLASPEEFNAFRDDNTNFFLLTPYPTVKPKAIRMGKVLQVKRRKLIRWIQRKHKHLLRDIRLRQPAKVEPFTIDTGDEQPIRIRPRPHSPLDLEKIKKFIDKNLANGVISESDSSWSAPLVLAVKPNGETRVCVDYRALNAITRKDAHPLPRIDESFTQFFGAIFFTTLDLLSGY
jgi:hypothetical protein